MKTIIKRTLLLFTIIVTVLTITTQNSTKANWKPCSGAVSGGDIEVYCWGCQDYDICGHVPGSMCCWSNLD